MRGLASKGEPPLRPIWFLFDASGRSWAHPGFKGEPPWAIWGPRGSKLQACMHRDCAHRTFSEHSGSKLQVCSPTTLQISNFPSPSHSELHVCINRDAAGRIFSYTPSIRLFVTALIQNCNFARMAAVQITIFLVPSHSKLQLRSITFGRRRLNKGAHL